MLFVLYLKYNMIKAFMLKFPENTKDVTLFVFLSQRLTVMCFVVQGNHSKVRHPPCYPHLSG